MPLVRLEFVVLWQFLNKDARARLAGEMRALRQQSRVVHRRWQVEHADTQPMRLRRAEVIGEMR